MKSPKLPMTPDEIEVVKMLRGVTYPIASFDKKMGATVQRLLAEPACNCKPVYASNDIPGLVTGAPKFVHASDCPRSVSWVPTIPEKMVQQLWRLVCRYRRQIRHPERVKYIRMAEVLSDNNPRRRKKGLKKLAERARDRARYAQAKAVRA